MAIKLTDIVAAIKLDTKEFQRELDQVTRKLERFMDIGGEIASSLTTAFSSWLQMSLETADSLDRQTKAFTNLAGSEEEAVKLVKEFQQFAAATPFETEEVFQGVKQFQAIGLASKDAIPLLQLFGETIAYTGQNADAIGRLSKAFTQVYAKGKLAGQEFNQFADNLVPISHILEETMGLTAHQVREKMEQGLLDANTVLANVLRWMGDTTGGAMTQMSNTLSGRMKSLWETFEFASAEAIKPLYDTLLNLIPVGIEFGSALGTALVQFIPILVTMTKVLGKALIIFNSLSPQTKNWLFALTAVGGILLTIGVALTGIVFAVAAAVSAFSALFAFIGGTGFYATAVILGIGLVVSGMVAQVGAAGILLYGLWHSEFFEPMATALSTFAAGVRETFVRVWQNITNSMERAVNNMVKSMLSLLSNLTYALTNFLERMPAIGETAKEQKANLIAELRNIQGALGSGGMGFDLSETRDAMFEAGKTAGEKIAEGVKEFGKYYAGLFTDLLPDKAKMSLEDFQNLLGTSLEPVDVEALIKSLGLDKTSAVFGGDGAGTRGSKAADDAWTDYVNTSLQALETQQAANRLISSFTRLDQALTMSMIPAAEAAYESLETMNTELQDWGSIMEDGIKKIQQAWQTLGQKVDPGGMVGSMANSIGAGMTAIGGPVGAIVGVVAEILPKTEAFAEITDFLNKITSMLAGVLDGLLKFIRPLLNIVTKILRPIIKMIGSNLNLLGDILEPLGAALVPLISAFQAVGTLFNAFYTAMGPLVDIFNAAFEGLYYVIAAIASVILLVAIAIGSVWNAIIDALLFVLDALASIPLIGDLFDGIVKDLENSKVDTKGMQDDLEDLWAQGAWDDAQALADHEKQTEEATEALEAMTEELINVPDGYKVALARMTAMNAAAAVAVGGEVPMLARGGIVTKPTLAMIGEAGPEAVVPLGKSAGYGTTIYIETVTVMADDIESLAEQLEKVASRKQFAKNGIVLSNSRYRFSGKK